jgi:O-antigen/teichoic acid export membrane protein
VRRLVVKVLTGGILLAGAGVVAGVVVIPALVRWYFGDAFMAAVPIFRVCLMGAVPYVIYVLMRNILDALDVKAVNSRNLIISLIVVVALCLVNSDVTWMAWSLVAALSLLGALTLYDTWLRLRPQPVSG